MFNKREKIIDLFVVTINYTGIETEGENFDPNKINFLTIASKKEECIEYINRRLLLENKEHFIGWCGLRDLDYKDFESWKAYVASTGNVSMNKYVVSKVKYRIKDVATIFRMFNECVPIGVSYETDAEMVNFMQKLPKETVDKIEEELKSKGIELN